MDMNAYIAEIKLKLGYPVLDLELDDTAFEAVVNTAFREIQRYISATRLATIPFDKSCIDLSDCHVSSVSRVFRADGYQSSSSDVKGVSMSDPLAATRWQMLSGGTGLYNMNDYIYNYASWNTMMQIRNTMSTDLSFRFDRHDNYLYVNTNGEKPNYITIEYVPRYDNVEQIVSDYWIDKLVALSVALTKQIIGRIRSRYTQSNALWVQDGEQLLQEAETELHDLRQELKDNSQLVYPID